MKLTKNRKPYIEIRESKSLIGKAKQLVHHEIEA